MANSIQMILVHLKSTHEIFQLVRKYYTGSTTLAKNKTKQNIAVASKGVVSIKAT